MKSTSVIAVLFAVGATAQIVPSPYTFTCITSFEPNPPGPDGKRPPGVYPRGSCYKIHRPVGEQAMHARFTVQTSPERVGTPTVVDTPPALDRLLHLVVHVGQGGGGTVGIARNRNTQRAMAEVKEWSNGQFPKAYPLAIMTNLHV
ncbi:hypothetical protein E6O75_ATG10599 [Venturia nashicola]|uniref:Uncharacterized protein n=1 Tax=Venturia nashicola TaxID=86259 RepID=A0A4Z1P289_9PEZI|nr:hypothetical protein E6O75_ATG10599 [Venturia nashicola]